MYSSTSVTYGTGRTMKVSSIAPVGKGTPSTEDPTEKEIISGI